MTFTAGVITGLIIGAFIAALLAVGAAHRKSEQQLMDIILEGEEKIMQAKDLEKQIKAMPWTGTDLNEGVDISCTVTASDAACWEPRRVKVYQPNADASQGSHHGIEVYYGQRFSGAIFDHIELVDPPKTEADNAWIREHLMTRIAPGGKLRLSKDMVPHTRASPSNQWKVGDEIVSVHSEAGTVVISKAYADRMGIEGIRGKVVDG